MKKVFILKHVPNEDAGTILDFLKDKKIPHQGVNLYDGDAFPMIEETRAVISLGGPMNADEEDKFPFLKEEKVFLKEAIARDLPCLGVCLGSQLLARSLGASVYKARQEEIGWDKVTLSSEAKKDTLFSVIPDAKFQVLQWHGDTFDLPRGAVHLASSRPVPNQAFRFGDKIYGLQFHVEVNKPMLKDWFKKRKNLNEILKEYDRYQPALTRITAQFYQRFFSL